MPIFDFSTSTSASWAIATEHAPLPLEKCSSAQIDDVGHPLDEREAELNAVSRLLGSSQSVFAQEMDAAAASLQEAIDLLNADLVELELRHPFGAGAEKADVISQLKAAETVLDDIVAHLGGAGRSSRARAAEKVGLETSAKSLQKTIDMLNADLVSLDADVPDEAVRARGVLLKQLKSAEAQLDDVVDRLIALDVRPSPPAPAGVEKAIDSLLAGIDSLNAELAAVDAAQPDNAKTVREGIPAQLNSAEKAVN